jgi:site-specific DNA recombinase
LSPDRLARKYAYQVLLLKEFKRWGCEVVFVDHPVSDDPNDQLLLQIQGAIAEYERMLLGERFRRGKLQKAREGHFIGSRASYGDRYVPKRDGVPGHLIIDENEAEVVRMLYGWPASIDTSAIGLLAQPLKMIQDVEPNRVVEPRVTFRHDPLL